LIIILKMGGEEEGEEGEEDGEFVAPRPDAT
jgi:hypothetical protein